MRQWSAELLRARPTIRIPMGAFEAGRSPRYVKNATESGRELIRDGLPDLEARVVSAMRGSGVEAAFSVEILRDGEVARTYGIGWRTDPGTLIVVRCPRGATRLDDGANWTVEIQPGTWEPQESSDGLLYAALYSHLLERGRALPADDLGLVRNAVRALHALGLELESDTGDPRRRPLILTPGRSPEERLRELVCVVISRVFFAGLFDGSKRWHDEARALSGTKRKELHAFAMAFGWRGPGAKLESALERDLCSRFAKWAASKSDVSVVEEDKDGALFGLVDGQRPDLTLREGEAEVETAVVEAKLGLTRDSVRTGLAQSREYGFHLERKGRRWPVILLVGEPPEFHSPAFADFVHDAASRLEIAVVVERAATEFACWHPLPARRLDVLGDGLISWLCRVNWTR